MASQAVAELATRLMLAAFMRLYHRHLGFVIASSAASSAVSKG